MASRGSSLAPEPDVGRERGGRTAPARLDLAGRRAFAARLVGLATLAVVLLWSAWVARWGLLLVYLSALIAVGMSPIARWIEGIRLPGVGVHLPRWAAAAGVYLAVFALIVAIGAAFLPALARQAEQLVENWPALLEALQSLLERNPDTRPAALDDYLQRLPVDLGEAALEQIWGFLGGAMGLLLILVLSIYLLHDARRLREAFVHLAPPHRRGQLRGQLDRIGARIGAWMMAQLMLSTIIGSTTALGLGLLGVPYSYVLALIAAIGELVPYLGPILAAIPGILIAVTVSWETAALVAVFYVVQQQLENHLLVPKLMQRQVGLPPSVVVIAMIIGSSVLGILGVIIAVPTAVILQVVAQAVRPDDTGERAPDVTPV